MSEQSTTPPPPPPPPPHKGDPEWWRRRFSGLTGLGLSDEERAANRAEAECRKCEKNRDYLMNYSPIVCFMLENIAKLNGRMDDSNIKCMPCENLQSGGFSPEYGVLLCQNRLRDRGHTEDTLAHELVHVYDHLRFRVDWEELKHHACSEIRASSLSGECRWMREAFTRGVFHFTRQHQACVKRRAILSVQNNPKCKNEAEATKIVNQVFDSCFTDTRPFSEIYR
ncbi:hypothetical protein C7212DRAFT_281659 [Tuber magnatum]|uniref:Mitochondrial inner membrane protease ATP23 n=1 Tax=Tuber magnatum TaxID=42249 RepID=A0A317SQG7_9PEZI|nr:hypothetical protein C7212DRAFT_281659 [Tuber magnatum]